MPAPLPEDHSVASISVGPRGRGQTPRWMRGVGWLGFALLCVFPLFFSLGDHPIHGDSEARYGVVARGMATGQTPLLVPTYFDQPHLTKPPLTYWLMAGSIWLVGDGELALRLPAALSGVFTLAIVFGLAYRLHGPRQAATAAAIVSVTPMFIVISRMGITDGPLALFMTAALASGILAVREGKRLWIIGLWFSVALALLVKGPVGLLVPASLGAWLMVTRQGEAWRSIRPVMGLIAAVLPLLGWGLLIAWQHPEAWGIWRFQTLDRAAGTGDHPEPWWFFVPVFLLGLLPATAVLWSGKPPFRQLGRKVRTAIRVKSEHLLWAMMLGLTFAVFSLISGKLISYLMPLVGPIAWWGAHVSNNIKPLKNSKYKELMVFWLIVLSLIGGVVAAGWGLYAQFGLTQAVLIWPVVLALGLGVGLVCRGGFWPREGRWVGAVIFWMSLVNVAAWAAVAEDRAYGKHSVPTAVAAVQEATGLVSPQILTVGFVERSLPYYTRRPTRRIDPRVLPHVWSAMRKDDLILLAEPDEWDHFAADPLWDLSLRFKPINLEVTLGYGAQPLRVYRAIPDAD